MKEVKEDNFVTPGALLSTAEEHLAGHNAYENSESNIRSTTVGIRVLNNEKHEVNVEKRSKIVEPLETGNTVIAVVSLVKDKVVMVEMVYAENERKEERKILNSFATLPLFNITNSFVDRPQDFFKIGDIIKAKVTQLTNYAIDLSTKEPSFGVIKAFCIACRKPLGLFGEQLKCLQCGNTESRKLSADYMLK